MKKNISRRKKLPKESSYYDQRSLLKEIIDEPVNLSLDQQLRNDILSGKRKQALKNITIKLDPLQVQAIRKIATMKSIPYQTLIRSWLSKEIKRELNLLS